jgi:hypothetical protein
MHDPAPVNYEIRVKGVLHGGWSAWFDGLQLTSDQSGQTSIAGPVIDQAALHGLLAKVRDLGLELLEVRRTDPDMEAHNAAPTEPRARTSDATAPAAPGDQATAPALAAETGRSAHPLRPAPALLTRPGHDPARSESLGSWSSGATSSAPGREQQMDSSISRPRILSAAGKLNVAGLVAAAAGIVIQIASGADYPTVPPGLIILLTAAGLVALGARWGWTTIVGVVVPTFLLVGGVVAPQAREQLGDPGEVGVFVGTVVQLLAMAVALVAGLVAVWQSYQKRTQT